MSKVKLFLSLTTKMKFLLLEVYLYLAVARILKARPFKKISSTMGKEMSETSKDLNPNHRRKQTEISQAIQIISNYTFWNSDCFVKAVAAMKLLKKRKIESTLYFGIGKDASGKLVAHAWLRSGPFFITGFEEKDHFTVVSKFAQLI